MRLSHGFLVATMVSAATAVTACTPAPPEAEERSASVEQPVTQVPCTAPNSCPDLVPSSFWLTAGMMVDTHTFPADSCAVENDQIDDGTHRLLRMSLAVVNKGPGELVIGSKTDHPDLFYYDECNETYSLTEADAIRLWRPVDYLLWLALKAAHPNTPSSQLLASHPLLRLGLIEDRKNHFCLSEYFRCEPAFGCSPNQTIAPSTHSLLDPDTCENNEGLSVGWMDVYPPYVDGQWVEVPDGGGTFILEQEVNPDRILQESDYSDNSIAVCVNIPPKSGHPFVKPNPHCITPPVFHGATDCDMCLAVCAAIADSGADQNECPCSPVLCPP